MSTRGLVRAGLAALLGAAIAFPAGVMFAGRSEIGESNDIRRQPGSGATMREVYSPKVLDDPYFVEQQRRNVEALEKQCSENGEMCYEAREARRWLKEQSAG